MGNLTGFKSIYYRNYLVTTGGLSSGLAAPFRGTGEYRDVVVDLVLSSLDNALRNPYHVTNFLLLQLKIRQENSQIHLGIKRGLIKHNFVLEKLVINREILGLGV